MKLRGVSHNFTERSQLLALLSDEQLGVANDVDQQNVTDLQLKIRMSGHIPLRPSDYMPYTLIYQQNFAVIRLYDGAGKVIATHDHTNQFGEL